MALAGVFAIFRKLCAKVARITFEFGDLPVTSHDNRIDGERFAFCFPIGVKTLSNNKKLQVTLTALFILLFGGVIYLGYEALQPPEYGDLGEEELAENREPRDPYVSPRTDGMVDPESGDIIAGGVERPRTDLERDTPTTPEDAEATSGGKDPLDYGTTPGVAINTNEQTQAVAEAIKTGRHPERLSVSVASKTARNFDPEKFDPESDAYDEEYRSTYLASPEPGRVWFPAQPAEGVERIQPLMPQFVQVEQGEDITLRVSGQPGQPVTFTSFDLGMFENQLTTMTVVANAQGVAEVQFRGPPGTIADVKIMAASPVLSGQVRLTVNVVDPVVATN